MQNQVPVSQNRPVTGRFAPSPSGRLHLGNLACSLLAWLSAKSQSALSEIFAVIARANKYIDENAPWTLAKDPANRARLATVMYNLLETIRICAVLLTPFIPDSAEKIFDQSECAEIYTRQYKKLEAQGLVYPCFCSRAQLHAASAPHTSDGNVIYPGTCRDLTAAQIAEKRKKKAPAWILISSPQDGERYGLFLQPFRWQAP